MPITFKHHKTANGLDIIAEVNPDALSAAAGFFVRTGARDEPGELMGVSHFLEHMMFKGTDDISADELNRRFDAIGARNNAYTTSEMTAFHAHVLAERLSEALDLLSRMMRPALRGADFETERGVILEEIAMYKDNPFFTLYEEVVDRHYAPHALRHRVLGLTSTVGSMTADAMRGYFEQRYAPGNTTVALAGNLDFDAACAQIEALCADWTTFDARRGPPPQRAGAEPFTMHDAKLTSAYALGVATAPAVDDDRRYAASMLAETLGGGDNSRLHWALIETGLAEEAVAGYEAHDGTGELLVFACGSPGRMDEIWSVVEREIGGLADSLTEDDLVRLRARTATGATVGAERPSDMMHRIGRRWTYLGEWRSLEEELERITSVTLGDLRETAAAFPLTPATVGRLLPGR